MAAIDRPIVLVTTSSEKQADTSLVVTALAALADEPVHVVATMPAGQPDDVVAPPNATVRRFVPHGAVLDRAVCAVTHGGMGATQKALARGVPVCVVPFGRDQLEVARRVEVARCGTRLPARRLSPRAAAGQGARGDDDDRGRAASGGGLRGHRRGRPRRGPLRAAHARPHRQLIGRYYPSLRSRGSRSRWNSSRKRRWSWPGAWKTRWLKPAVHVLLDLRDGLVGIGGDDPALGDLLDRQRVGGLLHLDRVVDGVLLLGGQRQRRPEPGVLQRQLGVGVVGDLDLDHPVDVVGVLARPPPRPPRIAGMSLSL